LLCDVRSEVQVEAAIARTIEEFGGIDICVNNASAISLTDTANTPMKRYDLMSDVNVRGTYMLSQKALPYLQESKHAHILNLSPPLDMRAKWFKNHVAYTIAKYGMSMCVLGMAEEFKGQNIAVNALWPITAIDTAAVRNVIGDDEMAKQCRSPAIMADAAVAILNRDPALCTGNFFIDEEVLIEEGVSDLSIYQHADATELLGDFFVPEEVFSRSKTNIAHGF
jgi:citronellol/citronellal dehydrogenase